jgi:uncharacterized protein (TIGR02186 family)
MLLGLSLGAPAIAAPGDECLAAGLAEDKVEVKVNYSGARIVLFASSPMTADPNVGLAVVIIGPDTRPVITRRINGGHQSFQFARAPSVFAIGAEPLVADTVTPETLASVGFNAAQAAVPAEDDVRDPDLPMWRAALVDLKMEQKLYSIDDTTIQRLDGGLRRARIQLPPNSPPGEYTVRAAMFRNGKAICQGERKLQLARGGLEATLYDLSKKHGLIYGIVAVMLGAGIGLIAAWVGRR